MKFLVTGSTGLVGIQVVKDLLKQNHQVFSCYHDTKPILGKAVFLDLADQQNIINVIQTTKPDVVIHLAAMTDVDLCETQKEHATKLNIDATDTLAKQTAKLEAFFIYVSTDYIFDGKKGMQKEDDVPNPLGFYGKTKLGGENVLCNIKSSKCIVRTSTPFGIHPTKKCFPLWVKENLETKKEISILTDQFTSPTYVPNLSKMIIEIATKKIEGIIHLAGSTRISRYDVAKLVADKLNLDKNLLKPITMDKMTWNAQRPMDSSLDISLASTILNEKPITIQNGLELFLSEL